MMIDNKQNYQIIDNKIKILDDDHSETSKLIKQDSNFHISIIDNILDKIGYTKFHITLIIVTGIIYISEGSQLYCLNMLLPSLQLIFTDNNPVWFTILASALFMGYIFGTFFTGLLTKKFGRYYVVISSLIGLSFFSTFIYFFENIVIISLCRFFIGTCIGIMSPQFISNLAEFLPNENKELVILSMYAFYRVGIIYFILTFKLIMPNYEKENWRYAFFSSSIFPIIGTVLSILYFSDSPKFLLSENKVDLALNLLDKLSYIKTGSTLTEEEKNSIINEYRSDNEIKDECFIDSFIHLLTKNNLFLANLCPIIALCSSMINIDNMYSLPLMLFTSDSDDHRYMTNEILFTQIITLPAIFLSAFCCNFIGRKQTLAFGFAFTLIISLIPSIFQKGLIISSAFINFFIIFALCSIKIYIIEAFPTRLRHYALGFALFISKIGDSLIPLICNLSFKIYSYGPIIITNILSLIGLSATLLLPYDTIRVNLK